MLRVAALITLLCVTCLGFRAPRTLSLTANGWRRRSSSGGGVALSSSPSSSSSSSSSSSQQFSLGNVGQYIERLLGWGGAKDDSAAAVLDEEPPSTPTTPTPTIIPRASFVASELMAPVPSSSSSSSSSSFSQSQSQSQSHDRMKLGVLLLNLGGPESMKDVEGFLFNLFADPDIIRLPSFLSILQKPIAYVIAKRRAPKSSVAYQSIGGGSPIVKYTKAQADLIRDNLKARGFDAECYFAMRYWNPYTEEVLERIRKDGINTLVIVPLYPQYSISTSGSSLRLLEDIFYRDPEHWGPDKVAHTVVPAWYYRKGYLRAMARLVVKEIASFDLEAQSQGVHVLFSAHGVPQSYIEAGDPYQRHIEECVKLVSREISVVLRDDALRPPEIPRDAALLLAGGGEGVSEGAGPKWEVQYHLSFQSRVGPVQWLKPYTEEKLTELGETRGIKNLVVVPVSFVSEHIETLEEIDMEYRELAHEAGITNWRRVPAPNTDAGFISDMADMVVEALESPTLSVSESAAAMSEGASDAGGGLGGYGGGVGGGMAGVVGFPSGEGGGSITNGAEQLTGRMAMLGLVGTTIVEFVNGHPLVQMVGLR